MPKMKILPNEEQDVFQNPPVFSYAERKKYFDNALYKQSCGFRTKAINRGIKSKNGISCIKVQDVPQD